jgi:hypothetical protein
MLYCDLLTLIRTLILTLLCAGVACNNKLMNTPQLSLKTMSENQRREQLGLRPVGRMWHPYRVEFGAEDWKLDASDKWGAKRIQRDSKGDPQWEEDYYYSGQTYKLENEAQDWEKITVHYDYRTGSLEVHYTGMDPVIRASFNDIKSGARTIAEKLSIVDNALRTWGLSRLDDHSR